MPRGGRRAGAGAPRGNLNRVTHGRRSKIIEKAIEKALADIKGRPKVLELVRRYGG